MLESVVHPMMLKREINPKRRNKVDRFIGMCQLIRGVRRRNSRLTYKVSIYFPIMPDARKNQWARGVTKSYLIVLKSNRIFPKSYLIFPKSIFV